jgi:DNA integrity scanning protein DisA with diadenylate cyclase activity
MARVDGALYLDWYGNVLAFACLLHGDTAPQEDRSKGSRYNSAIRFTREMPDALAIVVSSDGPVGVFARGSLINAQHSTEYPNLVVGRVI